MNDFGFYFVFSVGFDDFKNEFPVVEKDAFAWIYITRKRFVVHVYAFGIAGNVFGSLKSDYISWINHNVFFHNTYP
ncbi:hypothetical protein NUACC21_02490 [Scytonema sp. NUACC21]